jgi:hypothetical protein
LHHDITIITAEKYPLSSRNSKNLLGISKKRDNYPSVGTREQHFYAGQHRNRSILSRISAKSLLLIATSATG